jgi:hypothetical protein
VPFRQPLTTNQVANAANGEHGKAVALKIAEAVESRSVNVRATASNVMTPNDASATSIHVVATERGCGITESFIFCSTDVVWVNSRVTTSVLVV